MTKQGKKEKKGEFLSVRISPSIKKKLVAMADKEERSLSWVVGKILEYHFAKGPHK